MNKSAFKQQPLFELQVYLYNNRMRHKLCDIHATRHNSGK